MLFFCCSQHRPFAIYPPNSVPGALAAYCSQQHQRVVLLTIAPVDKMHRNKLCTRNGNMHHATIHTAATDEYVNVVTHKTEAKFPFSVLQFWCMRFVGNQRREKFDSTFFRLYFSGIRCKIHACIVSRAGKCDSSATDFWFNELQTEKKKRAWITCTCYLKPAEKNPSTNCISINLKKK